MAGCGSQLEFLRTVKLGPGKGQKVGSLLTW
jgi:hypothetical protein